MTGAPGESPTHRDAGQPVLFDITVRLLSHDFVQQALLAAALLGLMAGLIGPLS